jgi:hypothetical protein
MTTLVANIVTPSVSTAQLFFLIAVILAAFAVLIAFAHRPEPWWPFMWAPIMLFIALGLLWSP